jgi:uncharacterized protein (UPF0371 family)
VIPISVKFISKEASAAAWPDIDVSALVLPETDQIDLAILEEGMESGQPSVAIRIDLRDGQIMIAQTSAKLFCAAATMIMSRYPNIMRED